MVRFADLAMNRRSRHSLKKTLDDNRQTLMISPPPPQPPPELSSPVLATSSFSSFYRRYNIVIILFACVCGLIQGTYILLQFLEYQTTTTVAIERPERTELPSISLCFFYGLDEFIDSEKLNRSPEMYPVTLAEINDRLPIIDQWILDCKVLNATSYEFEGCLDYYNYIVEYLSLYSKCYSYFESLIKQIYYERKYVVGKWMVDITFNTSVIKTKRIGIYITHTYAELEESLGNPSFLQFDTRENNQAVATFKRTAVKRLPAPYDTNCFRYETLSCKHHKTCMRHCIMNVSYDLNKSWFSRSYVKLEHRFMNGYFNNLSERKLYANCSKRFSQQPCNDYHYLAILTSEFKSEMQENDTFRLSVAYPTAPKITVKFNPARSFMDSLLFFGGMFNLWTGVSLLMFIYLFTELFGNNVDYLKDLLLRKENGNLANNLRPCPSYPPPRRKISLISKGWIDYTNIPRTVLLNQYTSHGLSAFESQNRR